MNRKLWLLLLPLLGVFATPRQAEAQIPPVQWQLLALGSTDIEGANPSGELQVNLGIYGIGLALGIGGQGFDSGAGNGGHVGGAQLDLAIQLRPTMIAAAAIERHRPAYYYFDPHVDVGGLIGVLDSDDGAEFRGLFYVGGFLDFGIPTRHYHMEAQLLLTLGYRYVPAQSQAGPAHYILFGIGYRAGY